ncbi:hypothetical protein BSL78_07306 [Apostichopus japonicus]|uniref:Replication termination factor 2 n=1 Tax=Stichopus japonicus TaxID=307972 RepID=A0A2G8L6E8_STIJA|nr:hypothetical protein BSL78_07306 [Apostichopus japonicus]
MGGDGGSIPGRQDLVKTKRKPEKAERHVERIARWLHCAITQEKLRPPIVSCELGRLYNKEAVLEFLLDKGSCQSAQHLRSLKDFKELKLTDNPAYRGPSNDKGDAYSDNQASLYVCPVTGLEMSGRYRFCFLWRCGCVVSEKAIKEVKSDVCHKCGGPYIPGDEIVINGTESDISLLRNKMLDKRAKAKAEKKAKKSQKRKLDEKVVDGVDEKSESVESKSLQAKFQKSSKKVEQHQQGPSVSKGPQPLAAKRDAQGERKPEFDAKKSNVYKSLFLSKEDKDKKSPWVTYNPYYAMSAP